MIVDGEVLVLTNLLIDAGLLLAVAQLLQHRYCWWRIALGAGLGAAYALLGAVPTLIFAMGLAGKLLVSGAMVLMAFGWSDRHAVWAALAWFYGLSFSAAGLAYGLMALTGAPGLPGVGPLEAVPLALALLFAAAFYGGRALRRSLDGSAQEVRLEVEQSGVCSSFMALIDTGNRLRDPLTLLPVVVVEVDALREILPPGIKELLQSRVPEDAMLQISDGSWSARWRLIPYRSVGRHGQCLLGFRPDALRIVDAPQRAGLAPVVIALSTMPLSARGRYQALVPADLWRLPEAS